MRERGGGGGGGGGGRGERKRRGKGYRVRGRWDGWHTQCMKHWKRQTFTHEKRGRGRGGGGRGGRGRGGVGMEADTHHEALEEADLHTLHDVELGAHH